MWNLFKQAIQDWLKRYDRLVKLQHVYLLATALLVLVAAFANFVSQRMASDLLKIVKYSIFAFVSNLIINSVFESLVVPKLKSLKPSKPKKS